MLAVVHIMFQVRKLRTEESKYLLTFKSSLLLLGIQCCALDTNLQPCLRPEAVVLFEWREAFLLAIRK